MEVAKDRDLVIAIGGDGTLLRAAKLSFPGKASVLGVNLGRLGFLTDLTPEQVPEALSPILDGNYTSEERRVLRAEIIRNGDVVGGDHGLNDVVIQKWNTARLIAFETYVDGCFVLSQRSDGMIVSTPTGSTAYSLSGGGPILHPQLQAVVLVPICPHSLTNRPIVLQDTATIEIHVAAEYADETRVTCDGDPMSQIVAGDNIKISRHQQTVHLIHPASHDHFANLRAKLHWGQVPC
jgi:NAD+ kinase